jgi:putative transposase
VPEKTTLDKRGANTAVIESVKADACVAILMRQNRCIISIISIISIVEQDRRAIKRITRPMLGCKSFWSARIIITEIEMMHLIKKGRTDKPFNRTSRSIDFSNVCVHPPSPQCVADKLSPCPGESPQPP